MASNQNTITVVNKTIFCKDKEHTIKIDGTIIRTVVSSQNGSFINFESGYYIKVHNHSAKDNTQQKGEDLKVYLGPVAALAMASHILDQLRGSVEGNYEALTGKNGANIVRAGITNNGPGLSITIGGAESFGSLTINELRGFAELLKVTVANIEAKLIDAKAKDMKRRSGQNAQQ